MSDNKEIVLRKSKRKRKLKVNSLQCTSIICTSAIVIIGLVAYGFINNIIIFRQLNDDLPETQHLRPKEVEIKVKEYNKQTPNDGEFGMVEMTELAVMPYNSELTEQFMQLISVKEGELVNDAFAEVWKVCLQHQDRRVGIKGTVLAGHKVLFFQHNYIDPGENDTFTLNTNGSAEITGVVVIDWYNKYSSNEKRTKISWSGLGHPTIKVDIVAPVSRSVTFTAVIFGRSK